MSRLSKKVRSRKVPGKFEDAGRYIKCWRCGFPVDTTRNITGHGSGNQYEDTIYEEIEIRMSGDPDRLLLTIDSLSMGGVILEEGADGSGITDYYTPRKSVSYGGCALCGTKNLP
jgi:hypothetical protein